MLTAGPSRFPSRVGTPFVKLPSGGGAWLTLSDRNIEENFHNEDAEDVLNKIARMSIQSWNCIRRNISPVCRRTNVICSLENQDALARHIDCFIVTVHAPHIVWRSEGPEARRQVAGGD